MEKKLLLSKVLLLLLLLLKPSLETLAQTSMPPIIGDGTKEKPYQIATLENLYWLSQSSNAWNKHFIQTANIDATSSKEWDNGQGFSPIGNMKYNFTGTYKGNMFKLDGIYINRPNLDFVGLFGVVSTDSSRIEELGLTNIDICAKYYLGGLAGWTGKGVVYRCYTTGVIKTSEKKEGIDIKLGGLIGCNSGNVEQSFSKVKITNVKAKRIGGLVGSNRGGGYVLNCYAGCEIYGGGYGVGGLVGSNNDFNSRIENCFTYTKIDNLGNGLIGSVSNESILNSFYNKDESGYIAYSNYGISLTTAQTKNEDIYIKAGWDFENVWNKNNSINKGYPFLIWEVDNKTTRINSRKDTKIAFLSKSFK